MKAATHRAVYRVTEKQTPTGPQSEWVKVGVAINNPDGSTTIRLDPSLEGRLVDASTH